MLNHIAIIMDGNGRWAQAQGLPRTDGHRAGSLQIGTVARAAAQRGVKYLTLYAFSTENWKRPPTEVAALMKLGKEFSETRGQELLDNNIRIQMIGRPNDLPFPMRNAFQDLCQRSQHNTGLVLTLALSYGGRAEILDAINRLLLERKATGKPVTEEEFRSYLYDPTMPDPDLMIRTGGEKRLSNFLLWQLSYAELYVTDTLWPDFGPEQLDAAITEFNNRHRRFGGL